MKNVLCPICKHPSTPQLQQGRSHFNIPWVMLTEHGQPDCPGAHTP